MLQQQVNHLFRSQLADWETAAGNYHRLEQIKTKQIQLPGCRMLATFNPGRINSTAAKTDPQTIHARPCFLCDNNRPAEQENIGYAGKYKIIVNPYPIFKRHFTIPDTHHTEQLITPERLYDMLNLSRELPELSLFYNGPRAGASAPDHFHFQAGEKNYMPVETDIYRQTETWYTSPEVTVKTRLNYTRGLIIVEGDQTTPLIDTLLKIIRSIGETVPAEPEPMMNIITFWENSEWHVCIFPRKAHRPSQFFEEGDKKLIFSPGTVDFGGVLILPREQDYNRLTPELIEDIFSQLTFGPSEMLQLKNKTINL